MPKPVAKQLIVQFNDQAPQKFLIPGLDRIKVQVKKGARLSVLEQTEGGDNLAEDVVAVRQGVNLHLRYADGQELVLQDFHAQDMNAELVLPDQAGQMTLYSSSNSQVLASFVTDENSGLMTDQGQRPSLGWEQMAQAQAPDAPQTSTPEPVDTETAALLAPVVAASVAPGVLVPFMGAAYLHVQDVIFDDDLADSQVLIGEFFAGPALVGNGLVIKVFDMVGNELGSGKIGDDGSYRVEIGSYSGPIVAKIIDANDQPDFMDEATSRPKDLNAVFMAVDVVSGTAGSQITLNVNALTTVAAVKVGFNAVDGTGSITGNASEQQALIVSANATVATIAGAPGGLLTQLPVIATINTDGSANTSANAMGKVLAAISGMDQSSGGNMVSAIQTLSQSIEGQGDKATMNNSTRQAMVQGAIKARVDATDITNIVPSADPQAPAFSEGATNTVSLAENTTAAYTPLATDNVAVTRFELAGGADQDKFNLNTGTGALSFKIAPNFEAPGSAALTNAYSVQIRALDAALNSAVQTVTVNVQDANDIAPVITSGATGSVAENAATSTAIYTATSTDADGTPANQSVVYSLKDGRDKALLDISSAGVVTLRNSADFETKPSYAFTVVATNGTLTTEQDVTVTVTDVNETTPTDNSFNIRLAYTASDNISDDIKLLFTQAAERWSRIIVGDLPNVQNEDFGLIDDMLIQVRFEEFDGLGGQLAVADTDASREDNLTNLPYLGTMRFDSADTDTAIANNTLASTIFHEMAHALGFLRSRFESRDLLTDPDGLNYVGANALREYRVLTRNPNEAFVPLEDTGTDQTRGTHWRESVFGSELQTGFKRGAVNTPLSRVTIGAFQDFGYTVDYNQAEAFTLVTLMTPGFGAPSANPNVAENTLFSAPAHQATATGVVVEGYGLSGTDAGLFSVNAQGQVFFITSPNFENPRDADQDNRYEFTLVASGANNVRSEQAVILSVTNAAAPTSAQAYVLWQEAENAAANQPGNNSIQAFNQNRAEVVQQRDNISRDGSANQADGAKRLTQWVNQVTGTDVVSGAELEAGFVISGRAAPGAAETIRFRLDNDRTTGAVGVGARVFGIAGVEEQVAVNYNNSTGEWQLSFAPTSNLLLQATHNTFGSGVHHLVVDTNGDGNQNASEASRLFLVASGTALSTDTGTVAQNYSVQDRISKDVFVYYFGDPDGAGVGMSTSLDRSTVNGSFDTAENQGLVTLDRDGSSFGDVDYYASSTAFNATAAVTASNTALRFVTEIPAQVWEFHMAKPQETQATGIFATVNANAADHTLWGSNTSRLASLQELTALYAANFQFERDRFDEVTNGFVGGLQPISNASSIGDVAGEDNVPGGWGSLLYSAAPTPSGHALFEFNEGSIADFRDSLNSSQQYAVL